MSRTIISIILMVVVAPLLACSTVVCLEPSRWGGSINPITIVVMALFGLITIPLWPTYIPALIVTPLAMSFVARRQYFRTVPLPVLIGISLVIGAIVGPLVLIRMVLMSLNEPRLAMSWAIAGAVAGSLTLGLIVMVYRRGTLPALPPPMPDKCVSQ